MSRKSIDFASLRRFVADVPGLRRLLDSPALCEEELLLRAAMRRAISGLASVLEEAAVGDETTPRHAAALRGTSLIAARLTACEPAREPRH